MWKVPLLVAAAALVVTVSGTVFSHESKPLLPVPDICLEALPPVVPTSESLFTNRTLWDMRAFYDGIESLPNGTAVPPANASGIYNSTDTIRQVYQSTVAEWTPSVRAMETITRSATEIINPIDKAVSLLKSLTLKFGPAPYTNPVPASVIQTAATAINASILVAKDLSNQVVEAVTTRSVAIDNVSNAIDLAFTEFVNNEAAIQEQIHFANTTIKNVTVRNQTLAKLAHEWLALNETKLANTPLLYTAFNCAQPIDHFWELATGFFMAMGSDLFFAQQQLQPVINSGTLPFVVVLQLEGITQDLQRIRTEVRDMVTRSCTEVYLAQEQ